MLPKMKDFDFSEKSVILRLDLNSPLDPKTLKIIDKWRIEKAIPTILELKEKKAKQIIIAHQGRPGEWDFTDLKEHANEIEKIIKENVNFVDDIYGEKAIDEIKKMKKGDIILLDNVRKIKEEMDKKTPEEHAKSEFIRKLSPLADAFVNDAFASAHRSHCSLVGFIPVLPSFAGLLMEKEVEMIGKMLNFAERPRVFVFGGNKEDKIEMIKSLIDRKIADKVIIGGALGNAFLKDVSLRKIAEGKIVYPVDSVEDRDIGEKTIDIFEEEISRANSIFLGGPMGVFEEEKYRKGTEKIFKAIANSGAFTLAGGGHTVAAIRMLGLENKFSYVSTGGGAMERFLMGKDLPVIEALIKFKR
ncbi:MAG: phosphoglycerate kinase [Thermoplasmatales archaeon]|nr:phosphoglycerate kinase [Thermoplasmatales archaeon]